MKLLNLTLDHFKGLGHFELSLPDGCSANIYGENSAGKTTLADAYFWLLFGVDSEGRSPGEIGGFRIKTKGTSGLDYSVSGTFSHEGRTFTIRRVYRENFSVKNGESVSVKTGNTTDYYIDDAPCKTKKDFDAFLAGLFPQEIGRILSDPNYFPGIMKADERRAMLLSLFSPEITDDDVISRHPELASLRERKGYKTVEQYLDWAKAQRTAVNKELGNIPGRLDEANRAKTEVPEEQEDASQIAKLQAAKHRALSAIDAAKSGGDILEARRRLNERENAISEARTAYREKFAHGNSGVEAQIASKRAELMDLKRRLDILQQDHANTIFFSEGMFRKIEDLRSAWLETDAQEFSGETICPTCHQPLPAQSVDEAKRNFNLQKSEKLEQIQQKASELKEAAAVSEQQISRQRAEIKILEDQIPNIEKMIDRLTQAIIDPPPFEDSEEYKRLAGERDALKKELDVLTTCSMKKLPSLEEKLAGIQAELDELERRRLAREMGARQEARIRELLAQQKELNIKLTDLDEGIRLSELFIRLRACDLEEDINRHFKYVRWKLFETQVNGGVKNCCEAMVANRDGEYIEYNNNLNDGHRVRGGVDIINAIGKAAGLEMPLWIDRAGEVTLDLETGAQMIRLYASGEDKTLRVEAVK